MTKLNELTLMPFHLMENLLNEIDLDKSIDRFYKTSSAGYPYNLRQLADGSAELAFAFAGFRKEDISIKLEGDSLLVSATDDSKNSDEKKVDKAIYIHQGIARRNAAYKFTLSSSLDKKRISSKYVNGLLTITIPTAKPDVTNISIEE